MAKIPKAISDMSTLSRVIFDLDTIAPSVPANLTGTAISSSRIDLSWAASTDVGGSGLVGYPVYRNGTQIAQASSTAFSDTGLTASTAYQYQVAALDGAGNISSTSAVVNVTTLAIVGPPTLSWAYPTAALLGIAGVQDYPSTAWPTYAKFNTLIMGGYWEGHTSLNRQAAVTGVKAASTLPIKTLVFQYMSLNEIDTSANGVAYGLWRTEVQTRNWLCYLVGATGTPLPSLDGAPTQEVLYTDYAGTNPSLEYPYEFGAKYCYNAVLTTSREVRFSSLSSALVATNLDGILQDNFLCDPGINGDFNRDNITEQKGSPTVITPWLQAGQRRYCDQMRVLAPTKYVMANYGGGYGDAGTASAGVMQSVLDGGVCESFIGKSWSRDTWQGFTGMMAAYYKALDTAKNPQMVVFQGSWPDTASDGSALPRLPTANGFPPVYTLPQYSRYIAGCAFLGGGQSAVNKFSTGYSSNLADIVWPDEYDQAGAAALGWLGNPLTTANGVRPTGPRFKGCWVREFDNGAIVVNPSGNGTQTFTSTDLPGSFKTFAGTQDPAVNNNTTFTSITLSERDTRFLVRVNTGLNHGDSKTITGSGFPATMPSFVFVGGAGGEIENATLGATPSYGNNNFGGNATAGTMNWTRWRDSNPGGGHDIVSLSDATRGKVVGLVSPDTVGAECAQQIGFPSSIPTSGKVMSKVWHRASVSGSVGGANSQYKFQRLSDNIQDDDHNMVFTINSGTAMAYCNSGGGGGSETFYLPSGANNPQLNGIWQRFETKWVAPSSNGSSNGQCYYRVSQNNAPAYIVASASGTGTLLQSQLNAYAAGIHWAYLIYQNWWGNGLSAAHFAMDDHFVQIGSFACVEIWNAPTAAAATIREIQKPTAWSSTSITVQINKGGLPAGTYYLTVLADSVADTILAQQQITLTGN